MRLQVVVVSEPDRKVEEQRFVQELVADLCIRFIMTLRVSSVLCPRRSRPACRPVRQSQSARALPVARERSIGKCTQSFRGDDRRSHSSQRERWLGTVLARHALGAADRKLLIGTRTAELSSLDGAYRLQVLAGGSL